MKHLIFGALILVFSLYSHAEDCNTSSIEDESLRLIEILACADDPSFSISNKESRFASNAVKTSSDSSIKELLKQQRYLLLFSIEKQVTLEEYDKTVMEITTIQRQLKEERIYYNEIIKQITNSTKK